MRVIANFALIISHWFSWYGPDGPMLYIFFYYFLGNLVHFTVVFFFIVSGYFIRHSLEAGKPAGAIVGRYAARIFPIFVFWTLVYALEPGLGLRTLTAQGWAPLIANLQNVSAAIRANPLLFLMTGNEIHLWFLPSLVFGCAWLALLTKLGKESWIAPLAVLGYAVYLITGPYYTALTGMQRWQPEISRGFLTPIGCMSLGYWARQKNLRATMRAALVMVLAGYALKLCERFLLFTLTGDPIRQAFMAGTPLMSLGLFFIALNSPKILNLPVFARAASLTLGIYACHLIMDRKIHQFDLFHHGTWLEFFAPVAVYAATFAAVYALSLVPFVRRFVKNE